ncbi:hypothetical protein HDU82_008008 [Entophlyctis luteolus]|nr:hypothetical protein HDU82_008008 [Entophlyctis luteolus]
MPTTVDGDAVARIAALTQRHAQLASLHAGLVFAHGAHVLSLSSRPNCLDELCKFIAAEFKDHGRSEELNAVDGGNDGGYGGDDGNDGFGPISVLMRNFAVRLVAATLERVFAERAKRVQNILDNDLNWPAVREPQWSDELLDSFSTAVLDLASLFDSVASTGMHDDVILNSANLKIHPLGVSQVLCVVFAEVLVHFKFHFHSKDSLTNRNDKPEWLFRYALKLMNDHAAFLSVVQEILNRRPGNMIVAQTEFILYLLDFVCEKIHALAAKVLSNNDGQAILHLMTEAIRFDKTLRKVHGYSEKGVTDAVCADAPLLRFWIDTERDACFFRLRELMNSNPWLPNLFEVAAERYSLLPPSNRILFFDQVQLALLEAYLEECKSAVNEFQSSFVLGPQDPAFVQRFERLTKVLRVAAAIDAILTASMDWAENILYLELLNFVQAGQRKLDGDSVNFDQSLFHVMQKAYQNVLSQIEEVAVDDCLQYIVESLWRFDQK